MKKEIIIIVFIALIICMVFFAYTQITSVMENKTPQAKLLTGEIHTK